MKTALAILTGLAMLATLGTLFAGVFGTVREDGTPARANLLMRWRVVLQAATLVLFVLLLLVMRS
jgi:hypothetical protein